MKKQLAYSVIFEDDAFVAIDKPSGLAVIGGRGRTESLHALLNANLPDVPAAEGEETGRYRVVHRLDADTSGIILFAKSGAAHQALSEQFRLRTITKEYFALVRGSPLHESGSVDLPIGPDPKNKLKMVIRGEDAKKSRTKWVIEKRFGSAGGSGAGNAGVTLLKVLPVTGRRHQIRVHLKAMGYPLAVDPLYGGESLLLSEFKRRYKLGKDQEERPLMTRLTLHARALVMTHPVTGEAMRLEAPLPKDFRQAISALEKWARS